MYRRRTARTTAVGAVAALLITAAAAPAFATTITAPTGIKVQRNATDPFALDLGWTPPAGADNVRVSVFDGSTDAVTAYPVPTNATTYTGGGACTRYRIRFAAVAPDGASAEAAAVLVNSLAPGGLATITGDRLDLGTTGVVSWTAPVWWGNGTDPTYRVVVTESSTGRELVNTTTTETSITVPALDRALQYVVKVTPTNSFGGCFTSSQVLRAGRPSPPYGLVATRGEVPSTIRLGWKVPTWAGYGSITHYRIYYGDSIVSKSVDVTGTEATIEGFNPEKDSKFQVVAYDGELRGEPSASLTLNRVGYAGDAETDPSIQIKEQNGLVNLTIDGPVGSVPRQGVGRVSVVGNVGMVGSVRPRCTCLGRFQARASCGLTSLYSMRYSSACLASMSASSISSM